MKLFKTLVAASLVLLAVPAFAAEGQKEAKDVSFSFEGPFGTFDRGELQRGYKVYKEVCSACHSMQLLSFRNLSQPGGPGFSEEQVKALAATFTVKDGPGEDGEMFDRPGIPADRFPSPFANEQAARNANGGAYPPDLSLITKAREHGPHYVYSILTGFEEKPPAGFKVTEGKYFNPYFEGWNISMPQPLKANSVEYSDGTKATIEQEAHDVVTFLEWAAEPKMEERKRLGFGVMIFLVVLAGMLFASYRKVWKDAH